LVTPAARAALRGVCIRYRFYDAETTSGMLPCSH
jgi:hypothetical protein